MSANPPPAFAAPGRAAQMFQECYGLQCTAEPLSGEHDLNFRIRTVEGPQFTFKIARELPDPSELDLQIRALECIRRKEPSVPVPRVVRAASGGEVVSLNGDDGSRRFAHALTWLPGAVWAHAGSADPDLLAHLGHTVALMDRALADFEHPAVARHHGWDLRNAAEHKAVLPLVMDPARRAAAGAILDRFEHETLPRLLECPMQPTHNDANEHNVLIEGRRVSGIIDFGDFVRTHRVCNLAVTCAYAMLRLERPVREALPLVEAYHDVNPLRDSELAVLFDLILTRLAVSICMAARQSREQPQNTYLRISQDSVWPLLKQLGRENRDLAHFRFRDACGLEPNPATRPLIRWIEANSNAFAEICRFPMKTERKLVFDWSHGGAEPGPAGAAAAALADPASVYERMRECNARVGVGRYLEDRRVYGAPLFEVAGESERRTVHLGIDLFLEPGEPVFAPVDGVVYTFANNAAEGDYGPVVILEHRTAAGDCFWTLYGHLSLDSLTDLQPGKPIRRGEQLGRVGSYDQNGRWAPHLHFQVLTHTLDEGCAIWGVAPASEADLWASISPNPNLLLGMPEECRARPSRSVSYLRHRRRLHIGRALSLACREPLRIARSQGQYVYDEAGNRWLDMANNVAHVGHGHPRVLRAIQEQMARVNTNTRYLHENLAEYARRLVSTLPEPLSVCYFVNSGSEANDLALRLALAHTGRSDVVVLDHAYHGNLSSLVAISPYKFNGKGGGGCPPHTHVCELPDPYHGQYRYPDAEAGSRYAEDVAARIQDCRESGRGVAAFFAESAPGCAGQIVLPPGYLAEAHACVRAAGGVCVADEVQTGLGRVGSHWWAFETQGVVPDIVTMGKPIGNGHPLGAVVTTPAIARSFENGMEYFNTYGGNPVSCAAGLAVLDVIADERLRQHASEMGAELLDGLRELSARRALVGDVRGLGLFAGLELVRDPETLEPADREAAVIIEELKGRGILLSVDGPRHNVLKIKPPLVITRDDIRGFLSSLDEALAVARA